MSASQTLDAKAMAMQNDGSRIRIIDVAKDFSKIPGGRFKRTGPFSGEAFRVEVLLPALNAARISRQKVLVAMDGVAGYPASFLEEAFGGLIRENGFSFEELASLLSLEAKASRFKVLREMAWSYMKNAHG